MVRVGGGWVALDEFLVKNDPCRGKRSLYHLLGPWWNREGGCWNQFFPVYILYFWCLLLKYLSIIWVLYYTFNVPHEYFHILCIWAEQFILLLKQSTDYYYKGIGYKCPLINCVSEKSILTVSYCDRRKPKMIFPDNSSLYSWYDAHEKNVLNKTFSCGR